ncbi:MAG: hypothetical protein LBE34_15300 [Flavobacteriaceae bacterium]|jgi:hypothetical protein|nr:hypothetical protein [Flavobacteriaceae bacterium]
MKKSYLSAIIIAFMVVIAVASGGSDKEKSTTDTETTSGKEDEPKSKWSYGQEDDKMEGTTNYFATLESTNKPKFKFPYNGGATLSLTVRNMEGKNDVYLYLDKGQIPISIYNSESIKFKFDDGKAINYSYSSATGAMNSYAFFSKNKELITKIKAAKKIMIEVPVFDEGKVVFEFDAEGLVWDK